MAQMNVAQFAAERKMPATALLEQLAKAGVAKLASNDALSEQDKTRLLDYLRKAHQQDAINLLGICQGGVFSLCYAALHPRKVRNLITMVTPVDFHTADNMLSNWNREIDVDLLVDTLGNIPADMMNLTYLMLKPWRLFAQKYVGMVDILDDRKAMEDFLRMEKWIFDSPDQAGEAFR